MHNRFTHFWTPHRILPPGAWPDWIIRKVGDRPIAWLPPRHKKMVRPYWIASLVWLVDSPCLAPWGAFALGLYRPPERLMMEEEIEDLNFAKMAINVHENDPKYIRLIDRWRRAWGLAQKAADARVRARSVGEGR